MDCNFFAELLLSTWWLHFQGNIFILGPKSVSSFSCNTQQQTYLLKLMSAIFSEIFIFHQMVALQKLWKMFFISSKKLFSFSSYSNFCIFLPVSHFLKAWSKINFKVYDAFNCLKENLRTHFVWYLEKKKVMALKLWSLIQY